MAAPRRVGSDSDLARCRTPIQCVARPVRERLAPVRLSTTKLGPCHRDRDDRGRLQPTPDALDSYDISGPFVVELIGVCDVERYQRSRLDPLGVVSCHPGVPDLGQADGLTTEKNAYPVENRTGRLRGGAA
jgi:hypothetical protein